MSSTYLSTHCSCHFTFHTSSVTHNILTFNFINFNFVMIYPNYSVPSTVHSYEYFNYL